MKFLILLLTTFLFVACGNNEDEPVIKDPAEVRPPSENITDSTKIVNDSVIMPDLTPGNGKQAGNSDSIHRKQ